MANTEKTLQRLDKILTSQNLGSRKETGAWIRAGQIQVDGQTVRDPAAKFDPNAVQIQRGGATVLYSAHVYVMLHKPAGVLSASRDGSAPTVVDLLPPPLRRRGIFPAGRLDKDTTGLLILTDDGDYAHRFLSPAGHVDKIYRAELDKPLSPADVQAFAAGITLQNAAYRPARLWYDPQQPLVGYTCVQEGKFHQVKRMFHAVGKEVVALKRLQIGALQLDESLAPGECRLLTKQECESVFA